MAVALVVAAIFLCPEPAQAQWFNVRGTVYESSTLKPLPGANVAVNDSTGKMVAGRQTQENGLFLIPGVPAGKYTVKVSFMGFKAQTFQLNLSGKSGNKRVQDILLREDATMMAEAVVEGKLPEMTVVDDTVMYNASAFTVPPALVTLGPQTKSSFLQPSFSSSSPTQAMAPLPKMTGFSCVYLKIPAMKIPPII
jgi:hypothetical protein